MRRQLAIGALAASTIVGCGGNEDFANDPRPAVPLQLSGVINDRLATIQPTKIGAGPVVLTISNQSSDAVRVSLEGKDIEPQETGPINVEGTTTFKADLPEGEFELEVIPADTDDEVAAPIRPAKILVDGKRPSASDTLLLP